MLPAGDSRMEWTLRLVGMGVDGQSRSLNVMATSRPDDLGDIANLARLSQLDLDFGNFATARCRLGQEECALSQRVSAETGCGADQAPCETASGFGRLASCFYATSSAARTAGSTATGAS